MAAVGGAVVVAHGINRRTSAVRTAATTAATGARTAATVASDDVELDSAHPPHTARGRSGGSGSHAVVPGAVDGWLL